MRPANALRSGTGKEVVNRDQAAPLTADSGNLDLQAKPIILRNAIVRQTAIPIKIPQI
jgi:hypothetical protein